jgi:copper transport protein
MLLRYVVHVGFPPVSKRTTRTVGQISVGFLFALVAFVGSARPAWAHNSFVGSDPADGAVVEKVPPKLTLTFASEVVLAQLTVDFIDATGSRSALPGFSHSPDGTNAVLVPIPPAAAGTVTFRWKLVGSDGHTVSGRVGLTIGSQAQEAAPTTITVVDTAVTASVPSNATVAITAADTAAAIDQSTPAPAAESSASTGSKALIRWLLRLAAFVGLVAVAGVGEAWYLPAVRQATALGLGAIVVSTFVTALGFYGEINNLGVFLGTSYGLALVMRLILTPAIALAFFVWHPQDEGTRWFGIAAGLVALAATWSWSGHPRSLPLALVGVPLDVIHLIAAAVWIGGLAFMGLVVMRLGTAEEQFDAVKAFAPVASRSVTALVVTGVLQSLRIDGNPLALFTTTHGQLLLLKIAVLALMLYVANVNRNRVRTRFRTKHPSRGIHTMLQRAMVTEAAVGLLILAVTAVLVVNSPPPA